MYTQGAEDQTKSILHNPLYTTRRYVMYYWAGR